MALQSTSRVSKASVEPLVGIIVLPLFMAYSAERRVVIMVEATPYTAKITSRFRLIQFFLRFIKAYLNW